MWCLPPRKLQCYCQRPPSQVLLQLHILSHLPNGSWLSVSWLLYLLLLMIDTERQKLAITLMSQLSILRLVVLSGWINKGESIQPCRTLCQPGVSRFYHVWSIQLLPDSDRLTCKFLMQAIKCSGIHFFLTSLHSLTWSTQSKAFL